MANSFRVRILGLEELRIAFAALDAGLPSTLKVAFSGIATRGAARARSIVPSRSGAASGSIQAKGPAVSFGGDTAPYFPWLNWGGAVGRGKSIHRPWVGGRGRYIYPAIESERDAGTAAVESAVIGLARAEGFGTR